MLQIILYLNDPILIKMVYKLHPGWLITCNPIEYFLVQVSLPCFPALKAGDQPIPQPWTAPGPLTFVHRICPYLGFQTASGSKFRWHPPSHVFHPASEHSWRAI